MIGKSVSRIISFGCVMASIPTAVWAQTSFDVPAGNLKDTLNSFGKRAGMELIFRPADVRGLKSPGARGAKTSEQALAQILAGTGLRIERDPSGAIAITRGERRVAEPRKASKIAMLTYPSDPDQIARDDQPVLQTPRLAQSEIPDSQDIVVTAQKRAQNVNDVGLSLQAFTGDALKSRGISAAADLPNIVQGLTFSRSSANTPIFTLRGVGFQTPNLSSTSPVGLYLDEVGLAYPYMASGPTFDIERVEVLKGPQGTLYGRNTTGGLINYISAKPSDRFEAGGTVELGNYQTYNFEGYIAGPLADGLSVRLSGRSENSDKGWQKSVSRSDRLGKKDRAALRLGVVWDTVPDLKVSLNMSWWRDKSDTVAPQAIGLVPDHPAFSRPEHAAAVRTDWKNDEADWDPDQAGRPPFRMDSTFYSVSGRIDYRLNPDLSIVSLTSYNHVKRRDFNDLDGTAYEILAFESYGHIGSFSQEFRLVGSNERLNWLVGGFYSKDKISDNQVGYYDDNSSSALLRFVGSQVPQTEYTAQQIAVGFANFRNLSRQSSESASVLGNVEWKASDVLSINGGLRYTRDRLSFSGCSADYNGNTAPVWNTAVATIVGTNANVGINECLTYNAEFTDNVLFDRTLKQDNLAGRFGISYTPDHDTLIYASIARGFKSGAFPVLPANVATQFDPAGQEKLTAFEVGAKLTLADRAIQLNFSSFYYDYRNKQLFGDVSDPVFTTQSRIVNIPKSRVVGAEAEITYRPSSHLMLNLGATYVDSKVQRYTGVDRLSNDRDFAGSAFPYTPKWQLNGGVKLDAPINDELEVAATLNASYQSSSDGTLGGEEVFRIKDYTIVNGTLSLAKINQTMRLSLFVHNLFDKYYWSNTDTLIDSVFRIPGTSRTFGLSLSLRTP